MGIIPQEHRQHLMENFEKNLKDEVRVLVFTQGTECLFCKQARELAEVGALSNKINVSMGATNLSEETKKLASVEKPIHIQVFVSLTCPYCPLVTSLAHQFAIESDLVRADMVDVGEFSHLRHKYSVMGVPKTVINEKTEFVGAVPEELFVQQVVLAQRPTSMYV